MSYFLILERHERDSIFTTKEYGIWLSDIGEIKNWLKSFCKKNKIKINGTIDITEAENAYDFCRKRRKHNIRRIK